MPRLAPLCQRRSYPKILGVGSSPRPIRRPLQPGSSDATARQTRGPAYQSEAFVFTNWSNALGASSVRYFSAYRKAGHSMPRRHPSKTAPPSASTKSRPRAVRRRRRGVAGPRHQARAGRSPQGDARGVQVGVAPCRAGYSQVGVFHAGIMSLLFVSRGALVANAFEPTAWFGHPATFPGALSPGHGGSPQRGHAPRPARRSSGFHSHDTRSRCSARLTRHVAGPGPRYLMEVL